jgi:hypothetical protein
MKPKKCPRIDKPPPVSMPMQFIVALRLAIGRFPYWSATSIGMRSVPSESGRRAFPITAPNARRGSLAFMACPGVGEVVSRFAHLDRGIGRIDFAVRLSYQCE